MSGPKHHCEVPDGTPGGGFGWAIGFCEEKVDGSFWVDNDEYANAVNYCPVCGAKAPKPAMDSRMADLWDDHLQDGSE